MSTGLMLKVLLCVAAASGARGEDAMDYEALVRGEEGLVAWWDFGGAVTERVSGAEGEVREGEARYETGPGGTGALVLGRAAYVVMPPIPALDADIATVEFLFRVPHMPGTPYNPGLVAMRESPAETRFSIHVMQDLSQVMVWNGGEVQYTQLPAGTLAPDRWHHLAVTSDGEGGRIYLDGALCHTVGHGGFNVAARGYALTLGAATPDGYEPGACSIAALAVHGRVLTDDEVAARADALGWTARREALDADQARGVAEEDARRRDRRGRESAQVQERLADPALFERGGTRTYKGEHLAAINLPLGGIGTGVVHINGEARLQAWQVFNNYKYIDLPDTFFAIAAEGPDGSVTRTLQTVAAGPFPPMERLRFQGEYPFGWFTFEDGELPVEVRLEAFNPLIPLNARDSGIPCAIFNVTLRNPGNAPVRGRLLASQQNGADISGHHAPEGRHCADYGGNTNRVAREEGMTALVMGMDNGAGEPAPGKGTMALAFLGQGEAVASWEDAGALRDALAAGAGLEGPDVAGPSPAGETLNGALAAPYMLEPGAETTVTFLLTWSFPTAEEGRWVGEGNMYTNWWPDALTTARDVRMRLEDLTRETRLYHRTFYRSNLPHWLLDRVTSQVAILRTRTCYWSRDGYFGGWEGCCPATGCCAGNCNHVWHYAQAHARLFPEVARRMREQAFRFQGDDGAIPHRQPESHPAFDGQCGDILGAYREHLMSADGAWLDTHWPAVKRAMDYTIARWDADEDGVLAGDQWNTLDGALGGRTTWLGSLYCAALDATARMARLQGDDESAGRYDSIRKAGAREQDRALWNGEYYVQIRDPEPRQDYGTGCHIDQVLGEWWAAQLDLDPIYPEERVESALASLLRYNFRPDFHGVRQAPRAFVAPDDAGMQMIHWPDGRRPVPCILYGDEVMTGFEYSAAAAMVQQGMMREGFMVARAVWERYDGRLRTGLTDAPTASWGYSGNPFGDDECGKYYARAMSVWSLLLASQGFVYDGPAGRIGFRPVWRPGDHASFFTASEGYGLFTQRREEGLQRSAIEVASGAVRVAEFTVDLPDGARATEVRVTLDGEDMDVRRHQDGRELRVTFARPARLRASDILAVEAVY